MKHLLRLIFSSLVYSSVVLSVAYKNIVKSSKEALKNHLKQDPDNQLYIFELAQIFQDSNKYNKAIRLYSKSKLLDGEKGWYSEYMIGRCYELKGDWENAFKYYSSAFTRRSTRSEPLYDISQHYFSENNYSKVWFFAKMGKKIAYPEDDKLFLEQDIYSYKFREQLTIAAYYMPQHKHKGQKYIDELLFDHEVPDNVKRNCFKNLLYYVENIENTEFIPIQVNTPLLCDWSMERYKPYNPSIIKTDKGYTVNCRSVNCVQWYPDYVVMDGTRRPKSKNIFVEYDKDLNKEFEAQIVEDASLAKFETWIQGLEDLRIFHFKNEIYFVATTCQLNEKCIPKMCCGKFTKNNDNNTVSIDHITPLQGPIVERAEKNWMPVVINGELLLIYSFGPYVVYKPNIETGECSEFINKDPGFDFSRFAGSAPPIEFDNGYLLMVHEGIWQDRKYYVHRFLYLDQNLEIKKCSRPFTFKHKGIEMCCGMVINHSEDKLIMAIALEDREAYFGLIDLSNVRSLLKDLSPMVN